jgi:hypothetical protein
LSVSSLCCAPLTRPAQDETTAVEPSWVVGDFADDTSMDLGRPDVTEEAERISGKTGGDDDLALGSETEQLDYGRDQITDLLRKC